MTFRRPQAPAARSLRLAAALIACAWLSAACQTSPEVTNVQSSLALPAFSDRPPLCGVFTGAGYRQEDRPSEGAGSTVISYPPGRYTITRQIELGSRTVLSGSGSDKTTLYFPQGLMDLGIICPNPKDCWSWGNALIRATGTEVGVQNLTIEFPPHVFVHYGRKRGEQRGFNGIEFRRCSNCWASDVAVVNSDVGIYVDRSSHVTVDDTRVVANADGSHIHYAISAHSDDVLVNRFRADNISSHGITAQWGAHGVFANGELSGGVRLEPEHNGPVARTLFTHIHGDVGTVQSKNRAGAAVSATFIDVGGRTWGLPCDAD